MKILCVEDDPVTGTLLKTWLGRQGMEIQLAVDGYSAIRLAPVFMPTVLLLDYFLADMTGLELYRRLQGCTGILGVPAIVITAAGGKSLEWIATEAKLDGIEVVMQKPPDLVALATKIKELGAVKT